MSTTCPKCNYQRQPIDTAPDYECPKCGVVYAKVVKPSLREEGPDTLPQELAPDSGKKPFTAQWQLLAGTLALGIAVGYFAGREHVKYELRSAFQDAASGLSKGLSSAFGGGDKQPSLTRESAAKPTQKFPITATLKDKGYEEGKYGRSEITFQITFANATGKNVRAFDGSLQFTDLLDNEILGAKLAINDPVAAGQSILWPGKIDYNQFIARHESLRNAETANIKVKFVLKRVLFEDGTVTDF